MITKEHIARVLKVNGLDLSASDDEIKSVLKYAKCEDPEAILATLRDSEVPDDEDICGLQSNGSECNVLLASTNLSPESIKELLGFDVDVSFSELEEARHKRKHVSIGQILGIVGCSFAGALTVIVGLMWYYQIGLFHSFF